MLLALAIVTLPVLGGCVAEMLGMHGALMNGIVISLVFISIGMVISIWDMAGPLAALGSVVFASIIAGGLWAAQNHEKTAAAATKTPTERHRTS